MSTDKEQMQKVLMDRLEPQLRRRRFTGTFPHYRRFTPSKTDIVSVHVDERKNAFRIEVAELPPRDFTAPNGVWVEVASATTLDALTSDRARITPQAGSTKHDFSFAGSFFSKSETRFDKAADTALGLLPQADSWWQGQRSQPNIWAGG